MNTTLQNKIEEAKKRFDEKFHERGGWYEQNAPFDCWDAFDGLRKNITDFLEQELTSIAIIAQEEARKEDDSYRKIALLISSIFYYGNFKAETPNERELQSLLEKVNLWPTNEDLIVKRSNLSTLSNPTPQ